MWLDYNEILKFYVIIYTWEINNVQMLTWVAHIKGSNFHESWYHLPKKSKREEGIKKKRKVKDIPLSNPLCLTYPKDTSTLTKAKQLAANRSGKLENSHPCVTMTNLTHKTGVGSTASFHSILGAPSWNKLLILLVYQKKKNYY